MSLPSSIIKCTKCDFSHTQLPVGIDLKYMLGAREVLTGYRTAGWCNRCNGIQDIEKLSNIQECRSELSALHSQIAGLEKKIEGLNSNFVGRALNKSKIHNLQNELDAAREEFAETEKNLVGSARENRVLVALNAVLIRRQL